MTGLTFTFNIHGNELFFDRKVKSVTRSTVMSAYRREKELSLSGLPVDGPKKLGVFGACYLYPIFRDSE